MQCKSVAYSGPALAPTPENNNGGGGGGGVGEADAAAATKAHQASTASEKVSEAPAFLPFQVITVKRLGVLFVVGRRAEKAVL